MGKQNQKKQKISFNLKDAIFSIAIMLIAFILTLVAFFAI